MWEREFKEYTSKRVLKDKNKYIENMIKSEIKNPTEKIIDVIKNSMKK
jgi:hypothetical protein